MIHKSRNPSGLRPGFRCCAATSAADLTLDLFGEYPLHELNRHAVLPGKPRNS